MHDLSEKQVITAEDLSQTPAGSKLQLRDNAVITPLAWDIIRSQKLEILRKRPRLSASRRIALAADHGGVEMKQALKEHLTAQGYEYQDFGTHDTKAVDYPDYAVMVAQAVAQGRCQLGIMIDGAGIGSCMVANKVPGVRAAMANTPALARNSREHNDANVLTLGGKSITLDVMREIVDVWLQTTITEERHIQRVNKIVAVEKQFTK
jgi:ribose 5-phosphate isomerase B